MRAVDNQPMNWTLHTMKKAATWPSAAVMTLALALPWALAGCGPALNWRSVAIPGADLNATLPCKPDEARRTVELAGAPTELTMIGCEADGAMFAVSHTALLEPSLVGAALTHWRTAVIANLGAQAAANAADTPFAPRGALVLPQSVRTVVHGQRPDGSAVAAQAVWFARVSGAEVRLYHAVVYTSKPRPDLADQFFAGLAPP